MSPPPLVCGNGTRLVVDAGKFVPLSWPTTDEGPWSAFAVTWVGGPVPSADAWMDRVAEQVQAGDLVKLLERLGWPEAQLGKRWKKPRGGNVPAGR